MPHFSQEVGPSLHPPIHSLVVNHQCDIIASISTVFSVFYRRWTLWCVVHLYIQSVTHLYTAPRLHSRHHIQYVGQNLFLFQSLYQSVVAFRWGQQSWGFLCCRCISKCVCLFVFLCDRLTDMRINPSVKFIWHQVRQTYCSEYLGAWNDFRCKQDSLHITSL